MAKNLKNKVLQDEDPVIDDIFLHLSDKELGLLLNPLTFKTIFLIQVFFFLIATKDKIQKEISYPV